MVDYGHIIAGMDGYLHGNLELYKKMVKNSRDLIFVVAGREREGKSVLGNSILAYLDPTYYKDVNRCCFNGAEFLKQIKKAKNFQAVCYDEAQEFTSRGAITKFNRVLIQALSMIGMKQLYIAIIIPSFFELDRYPAIHRSNFLLRVYSVLGRRGQFEFWNWDKKKNLYLFGKKGYDYNTVKPNFRGSFRKRAFPFGEEYNKKKLKAIEGMNISFKDRADKQKAHRNQLIRYMNKNLNISHQKIAEIISKGDDSITRRQITEVLGGFS